MLLSWNAPMDTSTASDFDFLIGDWRVAHRRLKDRLVGSSVWQEFGGTCAVRKILGGQGNVDDNTIELPDGTYRAATLRAFDPVTRRWTIWWLDARKPQALDPPMIGGFDGDVGTFYGEDQWQGGRSECAFCGRAQPLAHRDGSRRFRWTPARAGRSIG